MAISFEQLTVTWRERLFNFVQRSNQEQGLKNWCAENEVTYATARNYFNEKNINSALLFIANLQTNAKDEEVDLSGCSLSEVMDAFEVARSGKKKKKPESIYLEAIPEDERDVFQQIWDSGMDLTGEIALVRFQIYRAKKYQSEQEASVKAGRPSESLGLVELKKGLVSAGEGEPVPMDEEKHKLADWDTVIQRLGQLLSSLMSLQVKIEFGERLTADEQANVISRTVKMVDSETLTAVQAAMALSSAGVKTIPLALDLKMREELSLMGDVFGDRDGNTQAQIDEAKRQMQTKLDDSRDEFIAKREKELQELDQQEDS